MKRTYLHIGEIAKLLGITQKAIRHYQKIGLLRETERSEAGYRLYDAQDLLRLQRIRRLRALGLSLKQVKVVLGDASQEQTLRNVLLTLDEELSTQIQVLEERRERVRTLLAMEILDEVTETVVDSPNLQAVKDLLNAHNIAISAELMAQEMQMYGHLENFHWGDGHNEAVKELSMQLLHYAGTHSEEYRQLLALGEQLIAIAPLSPDASEVEQLARDFKAYFMENTYFFDMSKQISKDFPTMPDPFNAIFSELMMSGYTPAQQRVFDGLKQMIMARARPRRSKCLSACSSRMRDVRG